MCGFPSLAPRSRVTRPELQSHPRLDPPGQPSLHPCPAPRMTSPGIIPRVAPPPPPWTVHVCLVCNGSGSGCIGEPCRGATELTMDALLELGSSSTRPGTGLDNRNAVVHGLRHWIERHTSSLRPSWTITPCLQRQ